MSSRNLRLRLLERVFGVVDLGQTPLMETTWIPSQEWLKCLENWELWVGNSAEVVGSPSCRRQVLSGKTREDQRSRGCDRYHLAVFDCVVR